LAKLLFDEPTSALDPIATTCIEALMRNFKQRAKILIVTQNIQQTARISDYTAFMYLGELLEFSPTQDLFHHPSHQQTQNYIQGKIG
jgi:phosphate transport system ATP-binding protein